MTRSLKYTVLAVGLVYLLGSAAQLSASGERGIRSGEAPPPLLAGIASDAGLSGLDAGLHVIVALSFAACALACTTALVRLVFAMSRGGLLPAALGRTAGRGTPAVAAVVAAGLLAAVPLAAILVDGSLAGLRSGIGTAAIIGYVTAYVLVCAAVPVFLGRIGERTWRPVAVALVTGAALAAALGFTVAASGHPQVVAGAVGGLAAATALGWWRLRRVPGLAARLGVYDAPVAADSIGGGAAGGSD